MPPQYFIIFEMAARRFYEKKMTTPYERQLLDPILNSISVDPSTDDEFKSPFPGPPENAFIYYDGRFWLIYDAPESGTVRILNMGFEEELPTTEREEPLL